MWLILGADDHNRTLVGQPEQAGNPIPTIHLELPQQDASEQVAVQNTPGPATIQASVSTPGQDSIPGVQSTPGPSLHVQAIISERESPADFRSPKRRRVISPAKSSVKEEGKAAEEEDAEDGEVIFFPPNMRRKLSQYKAACKDVQH